MWKILRWEFLTRPTPKIDKPILISNFFLVTVFASILSQLRQRIVTNRTVTHYTFLIFTTPAFTFTPELNLFRDLPKNESHEWFLVENNFRRFSVKIYKRSALIFFKKILENILKVMTMFSMTKISFLCFSFFLR